MIRDLTSLARPLKSHSKFKENGLPAKIFFACGALKRTRAARGRLPGTPPSASTPVTSQKAVAYPGPLVTRTALGRAH